MQKCEAAAASRPVVPAEVGRMPGKNASFEEPAAHSATGTERASKYSLFAPTAAAAAAAATVAACRELQEASGPITVVQTSQRLQAAYCPTHTRL